VLARLRLGGRRGIGRQRAEPVGQACQATRAARGDSRARIHLVDHRKYWSEVQDIYRKNSPEAAREIVRLAAECPDERVRSVCANWVIERAWGKPRDYDPDAANEQAKPKFNPALYSTAELERIYDILTLMAERQGTLPAKG
jgi:hypothetical protein